MKLLIACAVLRLAAQDTVPIGLEAAVSRALAGSPEVRAAAGAVRAPRGSRAESRWPFADNPVLEYGAVRRRSPVVSATDREWRLTQDVDIAGAWLVRGRAVGARLEAAEAGVSDARRVVALEVRRSYAVAAIADRRVALADSTAAFADRLAELARRQFEAGEANRLELNAAVLEAARQRSTVERFRAEAAAASADLARWLGWPADSVPRAAGFPALPDPVAAPDSTLLAIASARRPDLQASRALRLASERSVSAVRREALPAVTIAAVGGREAGTDRLLGFGVGVRVPLFYRRQAALGASLAERDSARAEETATERAVLAEVRAAGARYARARASERRFASGVLRAATWL